MLPNLVIIGAMKSGTSSLHSYLNAHPEIQMSAIKELDFFVLERNWSKGLEWYEANFIPANDTKILGESSPNYTKCHVFGGVPDRMHSIIPEAKLIYILRDPVDRIVSHYTHNYRKRKENRKLSEALADLDNNHYVLCSKYYAQLEQYLDHFLQSNVLIITLEELNERRQQTMQKAFRFLDVDDSFYSNGFSKTLYKSSDRRRKNWLGLLRSRMPGKRMIKPLLPSRFVGMYRSLSSSKVRKTELNERLQQALIDHLKDDVDRLRKHTGNDFEAWCL